MKPSLQQCPAAVLYNSIPSATAATVDRRGHDRSEKSITAVAISALSSGDLKAKTGTGTRDLHGGVRGNTLLDFGTGPSIYQHLSACEVFDNIIVSDFLEQNRAEFQKWLKKDQDAFDWSHVIKYVCELEGNSSREACEKKAEKLRSKLKEYFKCDALKRNPYDPIVVPPVDCLLSCLCLEVPCKDIKAFCDVLKNFQDLVKPGGHLLILSVLNETFYSIGEKRFSALTINEDQLETAFREAGYQIEKAVYVQRTDTSSMHVANYQGLYFIHACKPK